MKRLLLLSYAFPPARSPGAIRPGYLARYLQPLGWDVTVVTHSHEEPPFPAHVVHVGSYAEGLTQAAQRSLSTRSAGAWYRRPLRAAKETMLFPDERAPWILPALRACKHLMREERFDAIFSTALPSSMHVVGGVLAKRTGLPWIADYRDPWTGNSYMEWGPVKTFFEKAAERRLVRRAAAITTISEPIAAYLRTFHRRSDVHVVPNAYDQGDWSAIPDVLPQTFDLCYTGTMYDGKRSPELLFAAIARLREQGHPAGGARVHFYGPGTGAVPGCAERYGLQGQVFCHGSVPREDAMRAQRESAALLIFLSTDPSTSHETGSKYLEYLGARRPMLAFGLADSALREVIERNALGWFASDEGEAARALSCAYDLFRGALEGYRPNHTAFFTASQLAQRFAGILDAAVQARADGAPSVQFA